MKLRDIAINGSISLASVALFLIAGEIFLRVTGLQTVTPHPPKIYQNNDNPVISYELRPNLNREPAFKAHVTTNERGFRVNTSDQDSELIAHSSPLIAILGDSVAFGYGVEDNESLSAKLETLMPSHRFLNAAVPGYSLPQEAAVYAEKVAPLKPSAVMIVFFWNDLDGFAPGKLDEIGVLRESGWDPNNVQCQPITEGILSYVPGRCWLDLHSAFYKAVKKIVTSRAGKERLAEEQQEAKKQDFVDPASPEKLAVYAKDLHAFRTLLPKTMKKVFVIWPDRYIHRQGVPKLTAIAKNEGFAVINLYERFGNEAETLPWDTVHPSPETIDQAAKFITEKM